MNFITALQIVLNIIVCICLYLQTKVNDTASDCRKLEIDIFQLMRRQHLDLTNRVEVLENKINGK